MDPDTALAEIRAMITDSQQVLSNDEWDSDRLVELVTNLDEWLSSGGFLPSAWTHNRSV